ncbi:glycosyltransferase family 4 protein [Paracoccus sp. (in: a-proteobacteria)]|uniref:glycosyltransferase family 4 protein n=1 Tax=Paracoccus sp. TaxID=267 RepID=UPI0035B0B521
MRIALYAPMKSPAHPVPSGDRTMARLLVRALELAGHRVALASDLRVFLRESDAGLLAPLAAAADAERQRLSRDWRDNGAPDLWLCYHPYYKSPDLIGPALSRDFAIPYVTVESSWSRRRNQGDWARAQDHVTAGLAQAALNLSMTARDAQGLAEARPDARIARLAPFIDAAPFAATPAPQPGHFVTAAMMRAGDKLSSYRALAAALAMVPGDWRLSIAGDGPARAQVEAAFAALAGRVTFLGQLSQPALAALYAQGWLYLWPGHAEAYGLAALEAQAAGLPVISENTAGVPEVVRDGDTGILTPPGDTTAYARAIAALAKDAPRRAAMAAAARRFAHDERGLEAAAHRLDTLLREVAKP